MKKARPWTHLHRVIVVGTPDQVRRALGDPREGSLGRGRTAVYPSADGTYRAGAAHHIRAPRVAAADAAAGRWPLVETIGSYRAYATARFLQIGCQRMPLGRARAAVAASDRVVRAPRGRRGRMHGSVIAGTRDSLVLQNGTVELRLSGILYRAGREDVLAARRLLRDRDRAAKRRTKRTA